MTKKSMLPDKKSEGKQGRSRRGTSPLFLESSSEENAVSRSAVKIPKWYLLRSRGKLKKEFISNLVAEYCKPVRLSDKQVFIPTEMDIKDYTQELFKLSIKQLVQIGKIEEAKPKLSMLDKLAKLKKRKALLVSVYHKNGSRTHYVCARHTRILRINEYKYLCPPNMGNYDNKYSMMSYSYYEDNPFPIQFLSDYKSTTPEGQTIPDAELLEKTMEFEFAQKLAHSKLGERMNIAMIFSILGFLCSAATVILCLKGFNMI